MAVCTIHTRTGLGRPKSTSVCDSVALSFCLPHSLGHGQTAPLPPAVTANSGYDWLQEHITVGRFDTAWHRSKVYHWRSLNSTGYHLADGPAERLGASLVPSSLTYTSRKLNSFACSWHMCHCTSCPSIVRTTGICRGVVLCSHRRRHTPAP